MPERIQQKRRKGWRMPPGAMSVARPSKWGNPFRIGDPHPDHGRPMSRAEAVDLFRAWIQPHAAEVRAHLRSKDLACFCPLDGPCHADVLIEIANG